MKKIIFATLSLLSFSLLATTAEEPKAINAEMSCKVYSTRVENGLLKESQLLLDVKGKTFVLGFAQFTKTPLPAPYQNIAVNFNHFNTYYNESGPSSSTPFIQAYFTIDKEDKSFSRANFDILNPEAGSRILLRNTHSFSKEILLAYQCALTFVK